MKGFDYPVIDCAIESAKTALIYRQWLSNVVTTLGEMKDTSCFDTNEGILLGTINKAMQLLGESEVGEDG